jgi:uncharacterized protein YgiM (DUF1202 family)
MPIGPRASRRLMPCKTGYIYKTQRLSSKLAKNNRNLKLVKSIRCTTIFIYSVAKCNKAEDGHRLIINHSLVRQAAAVETLY